MANMSEILEGIDRIDESDSGIMRLIKDGYAFTPDEILEYARSRGIKGKIVKTVGKNVVVEYTIGGKPWKIKAPESMQVL